MAESTTMDPVITFSDFVFGSFPNTPEVIIAISFASSLIGMASHWFKKRSRDGLPLCFTDWFLYKNVPGTVAALFSVVGSTWATLAPQNITDVKIWAAFTMGWGIGYASDSIFNSQVEPEKENQSDIESTN